MKLFCQFGQHSSQHLSVVASDQNDYVATYSDKVFKTGLNCVWDAATTLWSLDLHPPLSTTDVE